MSEPMTPTDYEKRAQKIRTTLDDVANLVIQRNEINSKMKAAYDDLEARGLNRKAIKDAARLLAADEEKRFAYEKTKTIVYAALGWHFQPDLFAADEQPEKQEEQAGIGAENLDLLDAFDDRDDPDEAEADEDGNPDFTRAEQADSRRLAAVR